MIRKFFPFTVVIFLCSISNAQKSIDGLINAEKSFAAYSVAHGTKDAFLKFMDSSAIVFSEGKPVNALELWAKREKRPGILNWQPEYAEISLSCDFGFTSGPWTFRASAADTPVASGHFATVWHINKNGEWKFLIDFGINHSVLPINVKPEKIVSKNGYYPENEEGLKEIENDLNKKLSASGPASYKKFLSTKSRFNLENFRPGTNEKKKQQLIDSIPPGLSFTSNGIQVSKTNDLAFSYGTVTKNNKTSNYMRFWRREKDGWKIALEVLRY
jgi:ketosteroid isomerase-like protein